MLRPRVSEGGQLQPGVPAHTPRPEHGAVARGGRFPVSGRREPRAGRRRSRSGASSARPHVRGRGRARRLPRARLPSRAAAAPRPPQCSGSSPQGAGWAVLDHLRDAVICHVGHALLDDAAMLLSRRHSSNPEAHRSQRRRFRGQYAKPGSPARVRATAFRRGSRPAWQMDPRNGAAAEPHEGTVPAIAVPAGAACRGHEATCGSARRGH